MRRASPRDFPALRALCVASEGVEDYVIGYLEWEVANNYVHVALDPAGRSVGMAVYRQCIDGSGWLAMARTHPDFRRRGVNRAIVDSFVRLALRKGAHVLRLWTNVGNEDGVATFRRIGFEEVARFTRIWAPPTSAPLRGDVAAFSPALWRRIRTSPLVRAGGGLVPHGWEFVRADCATVRAIAATGAMRSWDRNILAIPDLPRPTEEDAVLQLTMLAGSPGDLLEEGRRIAAAKAQPGVGVYVPHSHTLLDTANRGGFRVVDWGDEAILCELAVPPRSRPTGSARAGTTRP